MNPITERINNLVTLSRELLSSVDNDALPLDQIQETIEKRQKLIDELDPLIAEVDLSQIPAEEQDTLTQAFRTYRELHHALQPVLNKQLEGQKTELSDASRRRKAEEQYHVLETPDISYFTDSK